MKCALPTGAAFLALSITASAQTPAGPEFRVNTYTTSDQSRGRPAMAPNGDFVVVWTSYGADGDALGVVGQRFAASGAPRGGEFQINTYTTGWQRDPVVAIGDRGDFVVVWVNDVGGPGSGLLIEGRRYDASGSAIGGEFVVNTSTRNQGGVRVGRASDGRFVVFWTSQDDGSSNGVTARRFDAFGDPVGSAFLVNTYTTGSQGGGGLAVDAAGGFITVWEDRSGRDGSLAAVIGQRYDPSGNPLGGEFLVNAYTTGHQKGPSVSLSPSGGFVVVWEGDGDGSAYGVFARRFDAAGNALGSDVLVNTYTTDYQYAAHVAHDALGNFVVTWNGYEPQAADGSEGSYAQRFSASGAPRGAEFHVNTYTTFGQTYPLVASDAAGNFVVTWNSEDQDGANSGVFAQRFGGLMPDTLAVTSPGHPLLEPGETAVVSPAWRNVTGAAQTFNGALIDFGGPAGAVYAITDPVGDYGTVGDGATRTCLDCYEVSVSNPPTRPALHWDATAVEQVLPDSHGQQKQWLLHVGASFSDVPTASGFYRFIETLLHHGVTGGCSPTQYCPATSTTRDQMAVFVLVAKEGTGYVPPACTIPVFADVPASNAFCRWIEELARRGVVGGCGGGNYCPASAVTREQMAVFVLRTLDPALDPPACTTPLYGDVPAGSGFCRWIEELTRRGVVSGCGGGNYCPLASVVREQMGVFLSATFGLALYGP